MYRQCITYLKNYIIMMEMQIFVNLIIIFLCTEPIKHWKCLQLFYRPLHSRNLLFKNKSAVWWQSQEFQTSWSCTIQILKNKQASGTKELGTLKSNFTYPVPQPPPAALGPSLTSWLPSVRPSQKPTDNKRPWLINLIFTCNKFRYLYLIGLKQLQTRHDKRYVIQYPDQLLCCTTSFL